MENRVVHYDGFLMSGTCGVYKHAKSWSTTTRMNLPANQISKAIEGIYQSLDGDKIVMEYHLRHTINSLCILTITTKEKAIKGLDLFKKTLEGKVVIEIGAGVGLFAIQCAEIAKEVYAIEADPAWSWIFTKYLYQTKPPNLTWIFGSAQRMIGKLTGDVCIIFSHSDIEGLNKLGEQFAPQVILGYQSWQETDRYKNAHYVKEARPGQRALFEAKK